MHSASWGHLYLARQVLQLAIVSDNYDKANLDPNICLKCLGHILFVMPLSSPPGGNLYATDYFPTRVWAIGRRHTVNALRQLISGPLYLHVDCPSEEFCKMLNRNGSMLVNMEGSLSDYTVEELIGSSLCRSLYTHMQKS